MLILSDTGYEKLDELSKELRLQVLAKFLKNKFKDKRTVPQIVNVIKEEYSLL